MNSLAIDVTHARAICDEIGERLRILLKSPALEAEDFDEKIKQLAGDLAELE